jgi:hypothetical protein
MPSELLKRSHRLRMDHGTDRPVNPDSVEPKGVLAGSIRQKGRSNTGICQDSGEEDTDPEEGGRRHYRSGYLSSVKVG